MSNYVVSDTNLTAVADAIRARGETQAPLAFPADFVSAIRAIPAGGALKEKAVNFWDYDGELVYSYTASEFADLESLPDNPTHAGLIAQGWNWTLADAQAYMQTHDFLHIGENYVTDDGKTRLYITIPSDDILDLSIMFRSALNGTIDWGDGTIDQVTTDEATHTYQTHGQYIISIYNGTEFRFGHYRVPIFGADSGENLVRRTWLTKVELGSDVSEFDERVFYNYSSLKSISVNKDVAYLSYATNFLLGTAVTCIVIPSNITVEYDTFANTFSGAKQLKVVCIPKQLKSLGNNAFNSCSIESISLPNDGFDVGQYTFGYCSSLKRVSGKIKTLGSYAFQQCAQLDDIDIDDRLTTLQGGNVFPECAHLQHIDLPEGLTAIGINTFYSCYALTSITIPSTVTSIGANAFNACQFQRVVLLPTTPPNLVNVNAFGGIPTDCKIIVPAGTLAAYQSATNWSTYAAYMEEAQHD